jgi:hypothetical protein
VYPKIYNAVGKTEGKLMEEDGNGGWAGGRNRKEKEIA